MNKRKIMPNTIDFEQAFLQSNDTYLISVLQKKTEGLYNRFWKRIFDMTMAIVLLPIAIPIFLIISIIQIITTGFPVIYKPLRGGYREKIFHIFKFRSMIKNADKIGGGTTAQNDSRITPFGNILRKTKIDEIPQLINIIIGKMSFVGPRPELLQYISNYSNIEKYILYVRPGVTDYSSLKYISLDESVGKENADEIYEKTVLHDKNVLRLKYVYELSAKNDIKIFFKTVYEVLKKVFIFMGKKNGKNHNS